MLDRSAMMAVYTWDNYEFLLDQPSPLTPKMVLQVAQVALGVLAFLHEKGVVLDEIGLQNFLVDPQTKRVFFFDPVIKDMYEGPVPLSERGGELTSLADSLRHLTGLDQQQIHAFLRKVIAGTFSSPYEMGREIESFRFLDTEYIDENIAGISDVGLVRVLNEDNWGWEQLNSDVRLYIVADGMGGHDAGEVASSMAVSLLIEECRSRVNESKDYSLDELDDILATSFVLANNGIKDFSENRGSDMGTTLVAALVKGKSDAIIANVGDSRAYVLRGKRLSQVLTIHMFTCLVEQGQLTQTKLPPST